MLKTIISYALITVGLAALPCHADTNIPDLNLSHATIAYNGPGVPCLLVVPDRSGHPFTQAFDENGNLVDATITLNVLDALGVPFTNYPREDMWLETADDALVSCSYGLVADQNTDANGMTFWVDPQPAGRYSEGLVVVMINGSQLTSNVGLPLRFNSPDINGDLLVNLADVAIFAGDYFGGYQFRSDFHHDGKIDLRDLAILAQKMLAGCP